MSSSTSKQLLISSIITIISFSFLNLIHTSKSNITTGYQITLAVPTEYIQGFTSYRAYLMETNQTALKFRTALSVDSAGDGTYSCSLQIFLGPTVKVWDSGHGSKFYTTELCVLELTRHGDLRLLGPNQRVGWRTGTTEQGVRGLELLDSGNLVLVDASGKIKWQTFNFPTDVLLWGQRLSVSTRLTSYPTNNKNTSASSATNYYYYYSLEIRRDKLALYLNSPPLDDKYSYWEFQPSEGKNITYVELTSQGLDLFDDSYNKFSQIVSPPFLINATSAAADAPAVKFLALENDTGNLAMYRYSPNSRNKFWPSYRVIDSPCDLPLTCAPYGICISPSDTCSCISLSSTSSSSSTAAAVDEHTTTTTTTSDCSSGISPAEAGRNGVGPCTRGGKHEAEMVELEGASTVLIRTFNASFVFEDARTKKACGEKCLNDCTCSAALYLLSGGNGKRECMLYSDVRGVRTRSRTAGAHHDDYYYMLKVPRGAARKRGGLRKWVLVLIVVVDVVILFMVFGSIGYFILWKRRKRLLAAGGS